MEAMLKECTKPHALLHTVVGVGLGLVLVSYFSGLASNALMLGLLLVVAGVAGEFVWNKK